MHTSTSSLGVHDRGHGPIHKVRRCRLMLGVMRRGVLRVAIGGRHVPPLPVPPVCRLLAALHRSGLTRRVDLHLEVSE